MHKDLHTHTSCPPLKTPRFSRSDCIDQKGNGPEKAALSHTVRLSVYVCKIYLYALFPCRSAIFFYLRRSAAHFRHFTNTDVSFHRALNQLKPAPTTSKSSQMIIQQVLYISLWPTLCKKSKKLMQDQKLRIC